MIRGNSSAAQGNYSALEPLKRHDHQDLFFSKDCPVPITCTHLKSFHHIPFQRAAPCLGPGFWVHTIFQVQQAGLTDVLQLAAGLAHFCLLEAHPHPGAPAEHCERPGTNLGQKGNTWFTLHRATILLLAWKQTPNSSSLFKP